jgi:hypothetical protein
MDAELLTLYLNGDRAEPARARALVEAGRARSPRDRFHAARALMPSLDPADRWRAYELAQDAVAGGFESARLIANANYDAWLVLQEQPQRYGTWRTSAEAPARDVITSFSRAENRLEIHELPDAPAPEYTIRPLEAGDPVPAGLPDGLSARRFGRGWCAIDADGEIAALWRRCGWRASPADYSPYDGGEAWIGVSGESFQSLAQQAGPGICWLVEGDLTRKEIRQLAKSLPRD